MMDTLEINSKLNALIGKRSAPAIRTTTRWRRWLAGGAALASLPALYLADTRLFPVVGKASAIIVEAQQVPGTTTVRIIFEKYRDCKFLASSFWVTHGGVTEPVRLLRAGPIVTAPVGRAATSELVLDVDSKEWIDRGMMLVEHRCHWFWTHSARLY